MEPGAQPTYISLKGIGNRYYFDSITQKRNQKQNEKNSFIMKNDFRKANARE